MFNSQAHIQWLNTISKLVFNYYLNPILNFKKPEKYRCKITNFWKFIELKSYNDIPKA